MNIKFILTKNCTFLIFQLVNNIYVFLGFTQYTDIESPLTSQLILSNGKEICFAIAQLNTIAINIDVEGIFKV